MRKKYESPEIEIELFRCQDIVTFGMDSNPMVDEGDDDFPGSVGGAGSDA